jgi:hypothetical protein
MSTAVSVEIVENFPQCWRVEGSTEQHRGQLEDSGPDPRSIDFANTMTGVVDKLIREEKSHHISQIGVGDSVKV